MSEIAPATFFLSLEKASPNLGSEENRAVEVRWLNAISWLLLWNCNVVGFWTVHRPPLKECRPTQFHFSLRNCIFIYCIIFQTLAWNKYVISVGFNVLGLAGISKQRRGFFCSVTDPSMSCIFGLVCLWGPPINCHEALFGVSLNKHLGALHFSPLCLFNNSAGTLVVCRLCFSKT